MTRTPRPFQALTLSLCVCVAGCAPRKGADWHEKSHELEPPVTTEEDATFLADESEGRDGEVGDKSAAPSSQPEQEPQTQTASYRDVVERGAIGARFLLVNGSPVTIEDVLDPVKSDLERKAASLSPEEYAAEVRRVIAAQIWNLINERLVYDQARAKLDERMFEVLDAEVDRVLQRRVNREFGGRQSRFEQHLAEMCRTLEDVREQARRSLLVSDFLRRKFADQMPEPTRRELWTYYQAHLDEFTEPSSVEFFLIDIPYGAFANDRQSRPGSADWLQSREKAREQARAALAELDSGMPFEAVAKTYSKGIHAREGGAWGTIGSKGLRGRYKPATDASKGMGSHEHFGVIEGSDACFIVGTGHVVQQTVQRFENAQPQIREALRREAAAELEREYVTELREDANIQRWREFQVEVIEALPKPAEPAPRS